MKAYICGSVIGHADIPKGFWEDIDKLIAEGHEVVLDDLEFDRMVFDRYRDVTNGSLSIVKINMVYRYDQIVKIIKESDLMITVWDGESRIVFLSILMQLTLGKKCRIYYLPTDECIELYSVESLVPYVPNRSGWTDDDIESVLRTCGFEEDMITHTISECKYEEDDIAQIICNAPMPLKRKLELLEDLQKKNDHDVIVLNKVIDLITADTETEIIRREIFEHRTFKPSVYDCIARIRSLELDRTDRVYYLYTEWYDTEVFVEKSESIGMFSTVEKAIDAVRREEELERDAVDDEDDTGEGWYRIEVWDQPTDPDSGEYRHMYDLYIYKDEICWFNEVIASRKDDWLICYYPRAWGELNMSTPFKAGDILYVDGRPFGPPFHVVILEGRYQYDCCMPTALYKVPYTDHYDMVSLKHTWFYHYLDRGHWGPKISPMYHLRKVRDDEFGEDDDVIVKVSNWINGSEKNGADFWRAWEDGGTKSPEDILAMLDSLTKNE